jgi:NDP-sugar pyrophosphorylase family protein
VRLLVLAGGFGTRLRTAVGDIPKALAPVGDVPFLQLQIESWLAQGIREFTFLLHHQADLIIGFLRAQQCGQLSASHVDWLVEKTPLDTGGALAYGVKELGLSEDFLFVNADTWLGGGIAQLMQAHAPAIAVVKLSHVSRYGQVHFDTNNSVRAFTEKNPNATEGWINAGLGRLGVSLFIGWDEKPFSLERDLYPLLVQEYKLKAIPLKTEFIDIGVPDDYYQFCRWAASGRQFALCN